MYFLPFQQLMSKEEFRVIKGRANGVFVEKETMNVNSFQLGIEAASQLINHVENPNLLATKIIVPHRIVKRDSCKEI